MKKMSLFALFVLLLLVGCRSTARKGEEKELRRLIGDLKSNSVYVRRFAAERLSDCGSRAAMEPLVEALEDDALKPLIKALEDEDRSVRYDVAAALVILGDKRAVEPLIGALQDERNHGYIQCFAAKALGKIGDRRVIESLIESLKKEGDYSYLFETRKMPDGREIGIFEEDLLRYRKGTFSLYAAEALTAITGQNFGSDYEKWRQWYEKNRGK